MDKDILDKYGYSITVRLAAYYLRGDKTISEYLRNPYLKKTLRRRAAAGNK